jgi:predicted O-methyltransferase YrrM
MQNFVFEVTIEEGASSPEELQYLYETTRRHGILRVVEIGFHLGFSSYAFLKANKKTNVISFDIKSHPFVPAAKSIIDRKFPGRHSIIYGDSTKTVPEFAKENPNIKFDLIFIDGGHDYKIAEADLRNTRSLAHAKTLVVMDDLTPWLPWGKGPARAWMEAIRNKQVQQIELYKDGGLVQTIEPPGGRAWALGRYIF